MARPAAELPLSAFPSVSGKEVTGDHVRFTVEGAGTLWHVTLNRTGETGGVVERVVGGTTDGTWDLADEVRPVTPGIEANDE